MNHTVPSIDTHRGADLPSPGPARPAAVTDEAPGPAAEPAPVPEIGGRKDGPEPTRYGDWEKNGRCVDF